MAPPSAALCLALLLELPKLASGLMATPFDTALPATFEGPDMIQLYPKGRVPSAIPRDDEAEPAKRRQESIDILCKVNYPQGNVYLVQEPALKPYLVPAGHPQRSDAAVIIAPGGGFGFLAWEREGTAIAEWLLTLGVSSYVLKYRAPSSEPLALIDAQRAVSFVRASAASHGLDPTRIGFMGFSAGGAMTADVSVAGKRAYARIDAVDDVDFHPDFAMLIYGAGPAQIRSHMHTPPPTFSISAKDDTCVSVQSATAYCDAVRRDRHQECQRIVYPNGGHGYGNCAKYTNAWWSGDAACSWVKDAAQWLQKHKVVKL